MGNQKGGRGVESASFYVGRALAPFKPPSLPPPFHATRSLAVTPLPPSSYATTWTSNSLYLYLQLGMGTRTGGSR